MKKCFVLWLILVLCFDTQAQIDHWETILYDSTTWKYQVPVSSTQANWNSPNFNDANWSIAKGGFGFGDNDDFTIIPNNSTAVYLRKSFPRFRAGLRK